MKKQKIMLSIMGVFISSLIFSQGYNITVKINNLQNADIILGHHFASSLIPNDTITLNKNGTGVFKGKEKLKEGMYFIYLPNKQYFDILIGADQHFSVENDTTDFLNNLKVDGSIDNDLFLDYQKFLVTKRAEANNLRNMLEVSDSDVEQNELMQQLNNIDNEVQQKTESIINENPGTFVSVFLKATQEIKVPDPPVDEFGRITDSAFQYRYYKNHYFDNFDIADARLLRTPLYERRLKNYFERIIPQIPDSIIVEVDNVMERIKDDQEVSRYVLVTLFNHYASSQIMGMDAVFLHIAEKYYIPMATWSSEDFITRLKDQVARRKPLLLGKTAPDAQLVHVPDNHFKVASVNPEDAKDVYVGSFFNLSNLDADYVILYFWEAGCSHCKKVTPLLHEVFKRMQDKNVQVVAVHTLGGVEGKEKWVEYVNNRELYGWINAWNPYSFDYKEKYDVSSVPVLFVLDREMKIVAKMIEPDQAEELINHLIRNKPKS